MSIEYPVVLTQASHGGVVARMPDFPDIRVSGGYPADALEQAARALTAAIAARVKARCVVPPPSPSSELPLVAVPAQVEVKLRLYEAMQQAGITKSELARRLRWHLPQVDRLLNVHHRSRLDQLEAGAAALGKRLSIVVDDRPANPEARKSPGRRRPRRARIELDVKAHGRSRNVKA